LASFEGRLWSELVARHGALLAEPAPLRAPPSRGARRLPARGRALLALAGGTLALLAVALLAGGGSESDPAPAYAVARSSDGYVSVEIRRIVGVEGADAHLASLGVPVRIARVRSACPRPGPDYRIDRVGPGRWERILARAGGPAHASLRIALHAIPPGDTVSLAAEQIGPGAIGLTAGLYRGPAPACVPPLVR